MTISRGQMYRQLYMGGGEGIASLDAGAPSIKYDRRYPTTNDICTRSNGRVI
jgi:hypothetical protein